MSKNSTFIVNVDSKDIGLRILSISPEVRLESNKIYADAFNFALNNDYPLKVEMQKILENKGLLKTEEDDNKANNIRQSIKNMEIELRKGLRGSRRMTKDEGKELALKIKTKRRELNSIGSEIGSLFNTTVDNYADNERLQYFMYACTVYADSGDKYWKSFPVFKNENNIKLIEEVTKAFISNISGVDKDYEKNLYENQWLIRMGFMNDKLQLIRPDGKLVDESGRLINDEGRFVNEDGDFVDIYGNAIDKDGNLLVEDTWGVTKEEQSVLTVE